MRKGYRRKSSAKQLKMNFAGRGRSTVSANGSNKSQSSVTSSGKSREHTGGVSLREHAEDHEQHTGGAFLHEDTERTTGASLTDNKEPEGGVSLKHFANDASNDKKNSGVNMSAGNDSDQASLSSVRTASAFSYHHKAMSVSGQNMGHDMETSQESHTPVRRVGLKSPMAPRVFNGFSRGTGQHSLLTSQHLANAQLCTSQLDQSTSAPTLPFLASPPQPSMAKPVPGLTSNAATNNAAAPPAQTSQTGLTPSANCVRPAAHGGHVTYNTGPIYSGMVPPPAGLNNAIPQSHFPAHSNARPVHAGNGSAAFKHDNPQSHPSVYNNVGPVPAGNGSQGLSSQANHQFGPNSGAMPAQESYVGRKNNANTPHRGHQVGQNNHMANLNNSNMGPPRSDNNLAQNNSTGVLGHSNAAAPTPSNAGTTLQAYFNPVTGQTMRLDGTIWTPHESKKDRYADHSVYNQSEPRNFAPRPMGIPVMFPPPPNFTSGPGSSSQIGDIITNQAFTDPFTSPDSSASNAVSEAAYFLANSHEIDYSELTEAEQELEVQWGLLRGKLSGLRTMGSNALRRLINGVNGIPTTPVLLNVMNFPFIESSSQSMPAVWGVIKISNIPFGTMRAEIIAMLGRNSKIITDAQEGVHIIMERVTSKTGDAFVEFNSIHAATRTVERHHEAIRKHRQPRLGDRPIKMTMSSQKELMEALFPLCRGVNFDHGCVTLLPEDPESPWNTFRGFVMAEELNLLIKHIEVPSRSPYSKDCPQRPFESMISTLKKLPWYASHLITLEQRQIIYDATFRLIEFLGELLQKGDGTPGKHHQQTVLNEQLYKRLVHAAMLCPGFSVLQKDNIAYLANMSGPAIAEFNMPPFSECWAHLYNLCPRPGVPVDVLEWYITLIREETVRYVNTLPASVQASIKERAKEDSLYFGYMWHEIQLPQGRELAAMTLRDVAEKELDAIKRILDRAAANAHTPLVTDAAYQHPDHYIVI